MNAMAPWSFFRGKHLQNYQGIFTADIHLKASDCQEVTSMSNIDILHPIDQGKLDPQYYFSSLMEQALACGLLSDEDKLKLQSELLMLLAGQTDKWSQGRSSSIPVEKAQEILESIMFVIGMSLKSYESPEQAAEGLKALPLELHLDNGMKAVKRKMMGARRIQRRVAAHLMETPNIYYRSTVVDGIDGFFKLYRPQFTAHEIHITVDYPAYMGRPSLRGIEFIEAYLRQIEAENTFCTNFDSHDIHHLLCGLIVNYSSIPMNLFEPVLLSALGLVIVHKSPRELALTKNDIEYLYRQLTGKSIIAIAACLEKAFRILNREMKLPPYVRRYISPCIRQMAGDIKTAITMKTLDKVFIVPAYTEGRPAISISYGQRMDDGKYRKLLGRILQLESSEDKVALILQEVHSLNDLLDILSDGELNGSDLELLISMLPLPIFVALLAEYSNGGLRQREREEEKGPLFEALQKRKDRMSAEEKRQIDYAVKAVSH